MRRPSTRVLVLVASLAVGVIHAALVVGVALRYGYDVGPSAYDGVGLVWRYGGLVLLGAVPVWFALEDRLVLPLALVVLLAALAFHAELTPPDPIFHDVADLEPSVDEPTGITVVEDGLHLVKYWTPWYVWTVAAVLAGLWEHVVRNRADWLPDPARGWSVPTDRNGALAVALLAGVAHALASIGYGWGWGMHDDPLGTSWALAGGVLLVGVPVYLLVRHDLVWPTAVATAFFVNSVRSQQYAGPGDPHALYAAAWFVFLALALLPGLLELALREAGRRVDWTPG